MRSFVILIFLLVWGVIPAQAQSMKACGGDGNWPPMSYMASVSQHVEGLSVDVLRSIFPEPKVALRPWARCLYEVQTMEGYDIVMSVFRTPERDKAFLFSRPYLSLTPSYLYATARYAEPPVKTLADLSHLKVCALHGASTFYTKLPPATIESGATNYSSLIKKIDRGYCDVIVDMREVFQGFSNQGMLPFNNGQYRIYPLPGTDKYPLHFGISRDHPQAAQLIEQIDRGLMDLQKNGKLALIIAHYQL
ncbi:substrate-binding periplasmic protein [Undibacterium sp.]|uniref:substrate-binding periplasmic protein n=1 Tax=Undibacterium sp. TaxID=1914977 RepID=UPI00374CE920